MKLRIVTVACVTAMAFFTAGCASIPTEDRGRSMVAMAKAVTGGTAWDRLEIMHDWGQVASETGVKSRYEHRSDLRTLKTRATSAEGFMIFDGRVAFQCEDPRCIHRTKLDASLVKEGAYLTSFGFFFPDRFPASFHYDGTRSEGGTRYDVIKLSPAGLPPVDLWLDEQTHRIARFVTAGGVRTDLSDYRSVDGITVPFVSTSEGVTVTSEAVRFERQTGGSLALFALP